FQYGGEVMQKSIIGNPRFPRTSAKCRESAFKTICRVLSPPSSLLNLSLLIETYLGLISIPTPFRPAALAASKVLPVPRKGSRTHIPRLVKNSMNVSTRLSGKPAGWTIFSLSRRGGLRTNHDFVNLIHSFPLRWFSLLVGLRCFGSRIAEDISD